MKNKKVVLVFIAFICFSLTGCINSTDNKNMYTGTVESDSFYITSETNGKVTSLKVREGDNIKSGDLAAKIDSSAYEIQRNQAEGGFETAKAAFDSLPSNAPDNQKKQLEGAVKQAQASVDLANLNISRCEIKSQGDGVISNVFVNNGEVVQAGTNLAKIMDISNKYVKVYIEESKRDKVKLRNKLPLYYNDKKVGNGEVTYISPEAEFTPKNTETKEDKEAMVFEVKIKLSENFEYTPGTLIDVKLD